MSPEQLKQFNQMQADIKKLMSVLDVNFIENIKRRAVEPKLSDLGLDEVVSKTGTADTSGVLRGVNEAGTNTYDVADEYDGTITVRDVDGTSYKLGYYTP